MTRSIEIAQPQPEYLPTPQYFDDNDDVISLNGWLFAEDEQISSQQEAVGSHKPFADWIEYLLYGQTPEFLSRTNLGRDYPFAATNLTHPANWSVSPIGGCELISRDREIRPSEFLVQGDDKIALEDKEVAKLTAINKTDRVNSRPVCSPESIIRSATETPDQFAPLPQILANSMKKEQLQTSLGNLGHIIQAEKRTQQQLRTYNTRPSISSVDSIVSEATFADAAAADRAGSESNFAARFTTEAEIHAAGIASRHKRTNKTCPRAAEFAPTARILRHLLFLC